MNNAPTATAENPAPTRQFTPLHIELMVHYATSYAQFERHTAPTVCDYTEHLVNLGLVESASGESHERTWRATDRGVAFLEMICKTPLPRLAWVTPTGEWVKCAKTK